MHTTAAPIRDVMLRLPLILVPAGSLPVLTYFDLPHLDLTGPTALAAYWIAESGSKFGVPLIGIAMTALLVSRSGIPAKQRVIETLVVGLALGALLGGGAYLNEHVVKDVFKVPRPNIIELAQKPPDPPILGLSAEAFYRTLPDKASRSKYLEKVLTPDVPLHERIRRHWIAESGYSFPSGHSFSSMMFATFFLAMGLTYFSGRRLWVFYLLVLWAVAVCFSRPILRVHSPTDVCVGALEGIVVGTIAFLLVRAALAVLLPKPAAALKEADHQPEDNSGSEGYGPST